MSRKPISQQYYTRGRQGIFRSNEGYDTVAKSTGLDNSFIKKTLHPFCTYDAPRQLQEKAESDPEKYPEALVSFRAESGELVIGRSVFAGADFTGQRNTFFSHNYVIPAERRDEYVTEPAKIFGLRAFASSHDEQSGKELPELDELPFQVSRTADKKQWLSQWGIDERLFKQLLHAVMSSLSVKKKVFISLGGDVGQSSAVARQLLEIMYGCLPYEMRRHFGFLTYANEPVSKKHIHVMCVEQGSIRPGSGQADKDFLFDLGNQRILNADPLEGEHQYLQFVWDYLHDPHVLASFHAFADEVLAGADSMTSLRYTTYCELCALYLIGKGRMAVYESDKPGIWQVLLGYLRQEGTGGKKRLLELLVVLFREEQQSLTARKLPASEVVRLLVDPHGAAGQAGIQMEVVKYVIDVLLKGQLAGHKKYTAEVYEHLVRNFELFGQVMNVIFGIEKIVKPLFEDYLDDRLARASGITHVLQEIEFWAAAAPQVLRHPYFITATIEKLLGVFANEPKKLDAALEVHRFFSRFAGSRSYADEILDHLDKCLLKQLSLETLSEKEIQKIIDLLESKPQTFFGGLDGEGRQKWEMLLHVHTWGEQTGGISPHAFFQKWDVPDIQLLQRVIGNIVSGHALTSDSFPKVALIFYRADDRAEDLFSYEEMLAFVHRSGGDEVVLPFIQWTMTQRMFFEGKPLAPGYRRALKQYFLEDRGRKLRDKAWRKRWMAVRNPDFRKLLEEVRAQTASPLVKLFRSKSMAVIGLAAVVTAGAVGGFAVWGSRTAPDETATPSTQGAAESEGVQTDAGVTDTPQKADVVPVYQLMIDPQIKPVNRQTTQ